MKVIVYLLALLASTSALAADCDSRISSVDTIGDVKKKLACFSDENSRLKKQVAELSGESSKAPQTGNVDIANIVVCTQATQDCEYISSDFRPLSFEFFAVKVPAHRKLVNVSFQAIGDPGGVAGFSRLAVVLDPTKKNVAVLQMQGIKGRLGQSRISISGTYGPE